MGQTTQNKQILATILEPDRLLPNLALLLRNTSCVHLSDDVVALLVGLLLQHVGDLDEGLLGQPGEGGHLGGGLEQGGCGAGGPA